MIIFSGHSNNGLVNYFSHVYTRVVHPLNSEVEGTVIPSHLHNLVLSDYFFREGTLTFQDLMKRVFAPSNMDKFTH